KDGSLTSLRAEPLQKENYYTHYAYENPTTSEEAIALPVIVNNQAWPAMSH
ncbi:9107_t:CDS:1, partial [Rhizophagus irregularis]